MPKAEAEAGAPTDVALLVDHLFRRQAGRMVAALTRWFGAAHLDLAEEVVQEALLTALRQWPYSGVPASPEGWLLEVARNRALDLLRRKTVFEGKLPRLAEEVGDGSAPAAEALYSAEIADDQLRMVFLCCHPSLSREARVALTLKTVGGFSVPEIARAFLAEEATIAQRLVRAKRRLRTEGAAFAWPEPAELPARLDSVLEAIYLVFNEGYHAFQGDDLLRPDLCAEGLRLALLLADHPATSLPKAQALAALLLFQSGRLPARVDEQGDLMLLADQDRSRWDRGLIGEGFRRLERAARGSELSVYHLEAGIASCHAAAAGYAATDWARIVELYDLLLEQRPGPLTALNRAIALAEAAGAAAGLAELDRLAGSPLAAGYYLFHAARGELQHRLGNRDQARAAFEVALGFTLTEPVRRHLTQRLAACVAEPATSPL